MRIAFTRIPEPEIEEIDPKMERRVKPKKKNTSPTADIDEFPPDDPQ